MLTYTEQLRVRLSDIHNLMLELIDNSRIRRWHKGYERVVIIAPDYYWDNPTDAESILQIQIKQAYTEWFESFEQFTIHTSESQQQDIKRVNEFILDWIEKRQCWSLPSTTAEAKNVFTKELQVFFDLLSLYAKSNIKSTFVVPDTNALITQPDPAFYARIAGADTFSLIYLPTVLGELDRLKMKSSNPDFQKKVKSVISRLKGYRKQGQVTKGVIVHKTITIKMIAVEPNFGNTLSWLDPNNDDDRIIASVLEIQRSHPTAVVCLVTEDINLQNKAEMACITYSELED